MILGLDPGPVETAAVNRRCALCHVPIYGIKTKRYCSNKCKGAAWQEMNREHYRMLSNRYSAKHREEQKRRTAEWRAANPEKVKSGFRDWADRNRNHRQKYMAEYWGKNPIKRKEYQSAYIKSNPDKCRIWNHNRRARISENGGKLSYEIIPRLIAKQKGLCAICNFPLPLKGYHVDHVIPLFHKGKNEDGNIQITCPGCNIRKGKKLCV